MGTSEVVLSSYDRSICHPTPHVGVHQQWAHKVLHFKMLLLCSHSIFFFRFKKDNLVFLEFKQGGFFDVNKWLVLSRCLIPIYSLL